MSSSEPCLAGTRRLRGRPALSRPPHDRLNSAGPAARLLDLGGRLVGLAGGWPVQLTSAASGSPAMLPLPMTEP